MYRKFCNKVPAKIIQVTRNIISSETHFATTLKTPIIWGPELYPQLTHLDVHLKSILSWGRSTKDSKDQAITQSETLVDRAISKIVHNWHDKTDT